MMAPPAPPLTGITLSCNFQTKTRKGVDKVTVEGHETHFGSPLESYMAEITDRTFADVNLV
jgi:hypothetical protein